MSLRRSWVLSLFVAGCSFDALTLPEGEDVPPTVEPPGEPPGGGGTGNSPPTVRFDGGDIFALPNSAQIRVASIAEDDDDDVLTFVWSASSPCTVDSSSSNEAAVVDASALAVGETCDTTVRVSDGAAEATASIQVRIVDRLTAVRPEDPECVTDINMPAGGSESQPWCAIQTAVDVAVITSQPLVRVYEGRIEDAPVDIPTGVEVRGGYVEPTSGGGWEQSSRTRLVFNAEFLGAVNVAGSLSHFELNLLNDCSSCTMVTAQGGGALSDVAVIAAPRVATGDFVGIQIQGSGTVQLDNVTVDAPGSAASSVAVLADGADAPLSLVYNDGVITLGEADDRQIGVATSSMDAVTLRNVSVSASGPAPLSIGFLDGQFENCTSPGPVCNGSAAYSMRGFSSVLTGVNRVAYGAYFAGTGGIDAVGDVSGSIQVEAEELAIGIRLREVFAPTLSGGGAEDQAGMTVDVRAVRGATTLAADDGQAIGIYDGDRLDPLVGPSTSVTVSGFAIQSRAQARLPLNVTGILLAGTRGARVSDTVVEVGTPQAFIDKIESAVGIYTLSVTGSDDAPVVLDRNTVRGTTGSGRNVEFLGAAFVDGRLGEDPSVGLELIDNYFELGDWTGASPNPAVACVILIGSEGPTVRGNFFRCPAQGTPLRSLWTLSTADARVEGNVFFDFLETQANLTHLGVVDGPFSPSQLPDPEGTARAAPATSTGLRIERNRFLDFSQELSVSGRGSRAIVSVDSRSDTLIIEGNLIEVPAAMRIAIEVGVPVQLHDNTIVGLDNGTDASRFDTTAVDVSILPSNATGEVSMVGNAIGARDGIDQDFEALELFVDDDDSNGEDLWGLWVSRFSNNVLNNPESEPVHLRDNTGNLTSEITPLIAEGNKQGELQLCPGTFTPRDGSPTVDFGERTGRDFYGNRVFNGVGDAGAVERQGLPACPPLPLPVTR